MNIGYIHLDYGKSLGTNGTPNNDCVLDVSQRQALRNGSKHDLQY